MQHNSVSARTRRAGSRRLGLAGAALSGIALAGASMVVVAPAQAASGPLSYSCNTGLLGEKTFQVVLDSDAPATVPVGTTFTPKVTARVTVPSDVTGALVSFTGASSVSGTARAESVLGGVANTIDMVVPKTPVAAAPLTVVATGTGAPITGAKVGDVVRMTGGDFTTTLTFLKADGTVAYPSEIACTLKDGQNAGFDTVRVVDTSATKATAAYKKARKSVTATAKVTTGAGTPATGKVQFVLKRGAKKVATLTSVVSNGTAKATFKKVTRKGKYQVVATYRGTQKVQGSKGVAKLTVR